MILIAICCFLGLIVAYQETVYFRSKQVEFVPVVVFREDVSINTKLSKGQMEYVNYPKDIVNAEFAQSIDQVADKYITRNAKAGTPVFLSDASGNKSAVVQEGMVRVSFSTTLQDALAGAIMPGSIVNIGFVSKDGKESKMLFQNVTVAKVTDKSGNDLNGNAGDKKINAYGKQDIIPSSITVILTPDEAVLLKQYETQGKIFLSGH